MRHLNRGRKLNRTSSHRRAMLRNLVSSLFVHGRVVTTPAKAKEARPFAEKLITLAKKGTLHARRRAISLLDNTRIVSSLFDEIAPRYQERPGGYSRILHLTRTRVGDSAPQVIFELVETELPEKKAKPAAATGAETPAADEPSSAPAAEAPAGEGEGAAGQTDPAAAADKASTPDDAGPAEGASAPAGEDEAGDKPEES